ncbi:MAG: zinc ribbon domain-containing protein [Verrucomicrobia bacterium]|nr:zinc ribbon domain-containing protein [Verrucomicrobiota bacterium]
MPTYEYECRDCHHQFELFQNITAKPITRCPKCKKNKVRRLIGRGAGIIFKGSGFHQTDYRSDHYKKQSAADKPGAQTSKPGAEASKPASKDGAKAAEPAKTEKPGAAAKA